MLLRTKYRTAALFTLAATILVGCSQENRSEPVKPYAYLTEEELVAMRGANVIGKANDPAAKNNEGYFVPSSRVHWTHDGSYALALIKDPQFDEQNTKIIVIDVRTGEPQAIRCESCLSIVPIGSHEVLASTHDSVRGHPLLRFNLRDGGPPVRVNADIPDAADWRDLIASTPTTALMTADDSTKVSIHGGPQQLFAINADGETRRLGSIGGDSAIKTGAGIDRRGRTEFVVDGGFTGSACLSGSVFTVIDVRSTTMVKTDTNLVMPNSRLFPVGGGPEISNGSLAVHSFWYDANEQVNASLRSWTCDRTADGNSQQKARGSWSQWRLDGNRWVKVSDSPVLKIVHTGGNESVWLIPIKGNPDSTRLILKRGKNETELARDIVDVDAPDD